MNDIPETRNSLLVRIADPRDREAWEQFSSIYRPVAYRLARARGLQDADAEELAQVVLISVANAISNWQRDGTHVRFRHWLRRVAKNAILNALTRQPRDQATGGSPSVELHDVNTQFAHESSMEVDLEYQRQVYRRAAELVRGRADETTWMAFSLTMIDGRSVEEAAKQLRLSAGSVYAARSRVIRRLRNVVRELEDD